MRNLECTYCTNRGCSIILPEDLWFVHPRTLGYSRIGGRPRGTLGGNLEDPRGHPGGHPVNPPGETPGAPQWTPGGASGGLFGGLFLGSHWRGGMACTYTDAKVHNYCFGTCWSLWGIPRGVGGKVPRIRFPIITRAWNALIGLVAPIHNE